MTTRQQHRNRERPHRCVTSPVLVIFTIVFSFISVAVRSSITRFNHDLYMETVAVQASGRPVLVEGEVELALQEGVTVERTQGRRPISLPLLFLP